MACFDNLIGLKGACESSTLSSNALYLNTLGINREFIEDIINEDYEDVDAFLTDKISLASDQIKNDIYSHFTSKFNVTSIIEGVRLGQFYDYPTLVPAINGSSKGLQMRIWNETTFAKLYVSTIKTYFAHTGNVNINVYDLTQAKLLDTIVVASVANQIVETTINKIYKSSSEDLNLVFIYDASTFASYSTSFMNAGCVTCNRGGAYMQNKYVYSTGVTFKNSDPKTQNYLNGQSDLGGISLVYSLECDHDAWICTHANFFSSAILYKTAYLITQYADLMSNTFSSTNIDREKLKQRMEYYEFEYNNRLNAGVKNLKIPSGDLCFSCNRLRMNKTILPS
jgi:hypothetical protein